MHIAHVLTRFLRAGSEENTLETCRWQVSAGHEVTLIHGADPDPYWDRHLPAGINRITVPQLIHPVHPVWDYRAVRALRRVYKRIVPDVIHTHQSKAGILGRLAATAVPDAVVAHGIHIVPFQGVEPTRRAIYLAAERRAARRTDVFIGVSEAVGRSYVEAGIARRGRVHCVRSGMDLDQFRDATPPNDWRRLLDVPSGTKRPPVVLMMAAFEQRKRHIPFLRALAAQRSELPDFKLLLAGRGPEEGRVRSEVGRLGLSDQVVFCGHRKDPGALFSLADLSVLTSEREGLPRVAVQSIAAGCPMLVQDLPGIEEVIRHDRNGCITDPTDMPATVREMGRMLRTQDLLQRLCSGARETDLSAWSLSALGSRTTALYGLPVRRTARSSELVEAA